MLKNVYMTSYLNGWCSMLNRKWAPSWFKPQEHWACQQCIVGPKCTQTCYRSKIYSPKCDNICNKTQQLECAEHLYKKHRTMVHCPKTSFSE